MSTNKPHGTPETETGGPLLGDPTVVGMESSIFRSISQVVNLFPSFSLSDLNDGSGVTLGTIKITNRGR